MKTYTVIQKLGKKIVGVHHVRGKSNRAAVVKAARKRDVEPGVGNHPHTYITMCFDDGHHNVWWQHFFSPSAEEKASLKAKRAG